MKKRLSFHLLWTILVLAAALLPVSCGNRGGKSSQGSPSAEKKAFPDIKVPSVYSDEAQVMSYVVLHYWDNISRLEMGGEEMDKAIANFITLLDRVPVTTAQQASGNMLVQIEKLEAQDSSRHAFTLMTQKVSQYMYDPNSPLRNEDYYLPFVKALAESRFTAEDMRAAFRFEAESCAINPFGSIAPDFKVRTVSGGTFTLHSIKADLTILFFSNPGCHACKGIIDQVMGYPVAVKAIEEGRLAVVNVYIDEDLKAWREYEHNYPKSWHTGYDLKHIIRDGRLYDVRAIPSIYLLDKDKKVILKDAPVEKVLARVR